MKNKKVLGFFIIAIVFIASAFKTPFFEIAKQIEIYNGLYKELNMNYIDEINPGDITDKAIKNTLKNLDPYTNFFNEQDVENARIRREGEYGGIGVSSYYDKNGITLSEIYQNYPADKTGLKAGDIIIDVNNQSTVGLEREQLSMFLKGVPGKQINLKVKRQNQILNFSLKLDKIVVNPVPFYEMIDNESGYIVLTRFNNKASSEVKKAFDDLKSKGMKKLVFDLRYNPGGSLYESINIVNFFIPKGKTVVETKGKTKQNSRIYRGNKDPLDLDIPIVILVNRRSASASEIVSGALQDYDRAVVMGQRSFGKGLVQRYFKLSYGTQLKATISKYYTPSGRCIQELNYADRDSKTGKVPKFSDGIVNSFKTSNGRIVKDGGGVLPDVIIEKTKLTDATEKLLQSRAIFNFVTDFTKNQKSFNSESYTISSSDFNTFKNYLLEKDTTFLSKQEVLFNSAYEATKNNKSITTNFNKIAQELKKVKVSEVDKNKDVLSEIIQDEIIERFAFKKGVYKHHLTFDKTIKEAVKLLNNPEKYNKILGK